MNNEEGYKEKLDWIDINGPVKYYPEFFREELINPCNGVKHIISD